LLYLYVSAADVATRAKVGLSPSRLGLGWVIDLLICGIDFRWRIPGMLILILLLGMMDNLLMQFGLLLGIILNLYLVILLVLRLDLDGLMVLLWLRKSFYFDWLQILLNFFKQAIVRLNLLLLLMMLFRLMFIV
jgi:hypothetical protein